LQRTLNARSPEAVRAWLGRWLASELRLDADALEPARTFLSYGLNSVQAMMLIGDLEDALHLRLPPTLIWDHRSIGELAQHIVERASAQLDDTANGVAARSQANAGSQAALQDPAVLLEQLDQLSEADVDALLKDYLKGSN
jgi:acyl carrier protein